MTTDVDKNGYTLTDTPIQVAKLNLWVVALCLALGVDSREIRPVQTVHNVLLLGNTFFADTLVSVFQKSYVAVSCLRSKK